MVSYSYKTAVIVSIDHHLSDISIQGSLASNTGGTITLSTSLCVFAGEVAQNRTPR